jgi:signal transduction histidine kinase
MMRRSAGGWMLVALSVTVSLGIATLLGFGYRATRGWQESSKLLTERDTAEATDILLKALMRDMAGMQSRVLASGDWAESLQSLADTSTRISIAFTRYPYPESFFTWRNDDPALVFFNRTDRHPQWMPDAQELHQFPVSVAFDPPAAASLRSRIDAHGSSRYRYVVFDTSFGDRPYQVVARLLYTDPTQERPDAVIGFTVNLDWVRDSYFAGLLPQIVRVANRERSLDIGIIDEKGTLVWGSDGTSPQKARQFPILFVDPLFEKIAAPPPTELRTWAVHVSQGGDSPLNAVSRGADQAFSVAAGATVVLCLGLVLAVRSIRAEVKLSAMRSDFVSSVTHELKMPLANISIMADSLALRPVAPETTQRYAMFLRQESKRLGQLIDNLLAYARVTDVAQAYAFEPVDISELLQNVLQSFQPALSESRFAVDVDVPDGLPPVRADRAALLLVFGNLVDNSVRYSADRKMLRIAARVNGSTVTIEVIDRGVGIPAEELPTIAGKFIRGRRTRSHGSGLGLAIVARVIKDHGGTFALDSAAGNGTTARITLPAATD